MLDELQSKTFRQLWANGYSCAKIAEKMGCFKHCDDGGRNAVAGIVRRMRENAEALNDLDELRFWSRGKPRSAHTGTRATTTRTRGTRKKRPRADDTLTSK